MSPAGRPSLDDEVFKLRFRRRSGRTDVRYYSDPAEAEQRARELAEAGRLLFYGAYKFSGEMT